MNNTFRVATFDIGRVNFAFYVEDINIEKCKNLSEQYYKLPKKLQRRYIGPMNDEIAKIHTSLFKCGERVYMCVKDLTTNGESLINNDSSCNDLNNQIRLNLFNHLKSFERVWETCNVFLIEEQYYNPKAKYKVQRGINKDAILLGECCYSYFVNFHYPQREVKYFKAALKTQTLGCENYIMKVDKKTKLRVSKKIQKYDRKKWSVEKAIEIFTLRNDQCALTLINEGKKCGQKQDDVADCVIMCAAYTFKTFILNE